VAETTAEKEILNARIRELKAQLNDSLKKELDHFICIKCSKIHKKTDKY